MDPNSMMDKKKAAYYLWNRRSSGGSGGEEFQQPRGTPNPFSGCGFYILAAILAIIGIAKGCN